MLYNKQHRNKKEIYNEIKNFISRRMRVGIGGMW